MAIILPKSVFFHIQKTGGNWIEEAVKQAGLKREFYNLEVDKLGGFVSDLYYIRNF